MLRHVLFYFILERKCAVHQYCHPKYNHSYDSYILQIQTRTFFHTTYNMGREINATCEHINHNIKEIIIIYTGKNFTNI